MSELTPTSTPSTSTPPTPAPTAGLGGVIILAPPELELLRSEAIKNLRSRILEVDSRIRLLRSTGRIFELLKTATSELVSLRAGGAPPPGELRSRGVSIARALEHDFLWDQTASSIDLIAGISLPARGRLPAGGAARALAYKGIGPNAITWRSNDFGGHNAELLKQDLWLICPERRVNSNPPLQQAPAALVLRHQFNALRSRINDEIRWLPRSLRSRDDEFCRPDSRHPSGCRRVPARAFLNRVAIASFQTMHDAAAAEYNVSVVIASGYRTPEQAAANAARVNDSKAVAKFSPHMLGVAVDLSLSYSGDTFRIKTKPFGTVVRMRTSPAHKFMFLFGKDFGWFPYEVEPWHWEFNPLGFDNVYPEDTANATSTTNPWASAP